MRRFQERWFSSAISLPTTLAVWSGTSSPIGVIWLKSSYRLGRCQSKSLTVLIPRFFRRDNALGPTKGSFSMGVAKILMFFFSTLPAQLKSRQLTAFQSIETLQSGRGMRRAGSLNQLITQLLGYLFT